MMRKYLVEFFMIEKRSNNWINLLSVYPQKTLEVIVKGSVRKGKGMGMGMGNEWVVKNFVFWISRITEDG